VQDKYVQGNLLFCSEETNWRAASPTVNGKKLMNTITDEGWNKKRGNEAVLSAKG